MTGFWDQKGSSIQAYKSQFFSQDYNKEEQQTYISSPQFMYVIEGRAREYGKHIGVSFAEGFTSKKLLGVDDLFNLR